MTTRMMLSNIASFGLQVTVLVAAGAALARAFRIDEPKAMYAYWRTLLFVCLVLPLCQPWNTVAPSAPVATRMPVADSVLPADGAAVASVAPRSVSWPIGDLVLVVLAAGIAARGVWLAIGAYGLRRLRRTASLVDPLPHGIRQAQERIGARATLYVSDRVSGPITFGLRRAVIVFPPSVSAMPADVQEAIAYHELLHVHRRDWLHEILEEAVRSVLWFHPAIWWLIGRIRLAREQVVDQSVIRLTDSKERYVEALLAVAVASSGTAFTPASAFLRRHFLKKRVARILQETTMTTRRLVASLTASAAALALAATFAVRSFPLEAQGRMQPGTGDPVQLVIGGEHLQHGELPEYPHRAVEQKVEGDVVIEMTLDDRGEVSDARVLSGPEELRKATLESVLQWHYSPAALRSTVTQATLRFRVPSDLKMVEVLEEPLLVDESVATHPKERAFEIEKALDDQAMREYERKEPGAKPIELKLRSAMFEASKEYIDVAVEVDPEGSASIKRVMKLLATEQPPIFEGAPRLVDVRTERVSEATAKELLAQAGIAVGDAITGEMAKRIREIALAMDEHFRVEFQKERGGLVLTVVAR